MREENIVYKTQVIGPAGIRYMNPVGVGNILDEYTQTDSRRYDYTQEVNGDFVFQGEDYDYWKTFAESNRRFDDVRINIFRKCPSGLFTIDGSQYRRIFVTYANMRNAKFDPNRCSVRLTLNLDEKYKLFDDRKGDEYNLMTIVSARKQAIANGHPAPLENGLPLYDVLLALLRESLGLTSIKSDFFQWNPDDPLYTIGNSTDYHNCVIFQQSDILLSGTGGYVPASILNMSLEDLLEDICTFLNLKYQIDGNNNFRIEHVSWFAQVVGLDLTLAKYEQYVKGKTRFSFETPKIYRREIFKTKEPKAPYIAANLDFVGIPIVYDNAFTRNLAEAVSSVRINREEQEDRADKVYAIRTFSVELNTIFFLDPALPESREGVVLLALDADDEIIKQAGILYAPPQLNSPFAWSKLHDNFWRHERLFESGYMNGSSTIFMSTQRIKNQETLTIPICCDETIDPNKLVTTELGDGIIRKLSIDRFKGLAKIDVAFTFDAFAFLTAPDAVNDKYATGIDIPIDTVADSKPSLLANDTGATEAVPETKATDRGGEVSILSTGHFLYTPPAGISGVDAFEYIALNVLGNADFARASILLKVGDVYIHLVNNSHEVFLYPPGSGSFWSYSWTVYYYEDPTLQIPLNLDDYGITIQYDKNKNGVITTHGVLAEGFSTQLVGDIEPVSIPYSVTLLADPSYTII